MDQIGKNFGLQIPIEVSNTNYTLELKSGKRINKLLISNSINGSSKSNVETQQSKLDSRSEHGKKHQQMVGVEDQRQGILIGDEFGKEASQSKTGNLDLRDKLVEDEMGEVVYGKVGLDLIEQSRNKESETLNNEDLGFERLDTLKHESKSLKKAINTINIKLELLAEDFEKTSSISKPNSKRKRNGQRKLKRINELYALDFENKKRNLIEELNLFQRVLKKVEKKINKTKKTVERK